MKTNIDIKTSNQNIEYFDALNFMEKKVDKILDNKENEMLWFLNHNHIYTCGTSANKNEILFKTNTPIFKTNRGGKYTVHSPGQKVIYFVLNLNKRKKDIRKLINNIESCIINILHEFGEYNKIWQAFAILIPTKTVGVMGDARTYENLIALRAVTSLDGMTADWYNLPNEVLTNCSTEIINKVEGVNRVVYDVTSKPPGTIEWE